MNNAATIQVEAGLNDTISHCPLHSPNHRDRAQRLHCHESLTIDVLASCANGAMAQVACLDHILA
eukprot:5260394-Amphidinium_carterae.1